MCYGKLQETGSLLKSRFGAKDGQTITRIVRRLVVRIAAINQQECKFDIVRHANDSGFTHGRS